MPRRRRLVLMVIALCGTTIGLLLLAYLSSLPIVWQSPETNRPVAKPDELIAQPELAEQDGETEATVNAAPPEPLPPNVPTILLADQPIVPGSLDVDVRTLPRVPPSPSSRPEFEFEPSAAKQANSVGSAQPPVPALALAAMPTPTLTFNAMDFNNDGAGHPPDTNGDIGPTYYMEAVNTSIGIYNKQTGVNVTSFTFNSFWLGAGTGTACDNAHQGDPIVLYDPIADRWIFMDFAWASGNLQDGPYYFCFAVSKTGDPVAGGYWLYAIRGDDAAHPWLPDYPKGGVWPDGLYFSANMFDCLNASCSSATYQEARAYALNRSKMEAGQTLTANDVQAKDTTSSYFTLMPSNMRGAQPPAGTPNYFVSEDQSIYAWDVFKFHVDYTTPANSTFTGPTQVSQASYFLAAASVPEPAPGNNSDTLRDRAMFLNQYRSISSTESLWVQHTVGTASASTPTGIQWAQINVTGGTIATTPVQQQIFNNGADGLNRFMGSMAVDGNGNVALGYTASSSSVAPDIRYVGRLASDPLNQMPRTEVTLLPGVTRSVQTGTCGGGACIRWGDYSAMTVDPIDDCTFWYANMYFPVQGNNWVTRIGSFKFPACTAGTLPDLTATKTNNVGGTIASGGSWVWQITVANSGGAAASFANGQVILTDTLPNTNISYGTVVVTPTNVTGAINCSINSFTLSCTASGSVSVAAANGSFDVSFNATPTATGAFANPRGGGSCTVDPNNTVSEGNEGNNTCNDSVTVNSAGITGLGAVNSSPTTLGQTTAFTASVTGGSNITYTWNFGDGVLGNGSTTAHLYAATGFYTARVTATNVVSTVFTTTPVTITNLPPIANAGVDQNVTVSSVVTLTGSSSFDLDGHLPLTYRWAQSGGPVVVVSNPTLSVTTFTAPSSPAVLTFTLAVTDARGLADATPDLTVVTVQDIPISNLTAINSSPTPLNDVTTFTATISSGSHVTYTWDFGDGTAFAPGNVVTHTYGTFGGFTAVVTATNSASTVTETTPVVIVAPYRVFLPLILNSQ